MVKIGTDNTFKDKMKKILDKILSDLIEKLRIFTPLIDEMRTSDSYYQELYNLIISLQEVYKNVDMKMILQYSDIRKDFLKDSDNILDYLLFISDGNIMLMSCERFKNIIIYLDYLLSQLVEYHEYLNYIDDEFNRNIEPRRDIFINFI